MRSGLDGLDKRKICDKYIDVGLLKAANGSTTERIVYATPSNDCFLNTDGTLLKIKTNRNALDLIAFL